MTISETIAKAIEKMLVEKYRDEEIWPTREEEFAELIQAEILKGFSKT